MTRLIQVVIVVMIQVVVIVIEVMVVVIQVMVVVIQVVVDLPDVQGLPKGMAELVV